MYLISEDPSRMSANWDSNEMVYSERTRSTCFLDQILGEDREHNAGGMVYLIHEGAAAPKERVLRGESAEADAKISFYPHGKMQPMQSEGIRSKYRQQKTGYESPLQSRLLQANRSTAMTLARRT
jgi:hypothetical protein